MYTERVGDDRSSGVSAGTTATDRAYAQLRRDILDGELLPGSELLEVEQSRRLGVSRTPVRAAIARLAAEGLVSARGIRGYVVSDESAESITALYELREALEEQAARLAAMRRDPLAFIGIRDDLRTATDLLGQGLAGLDRYYEIIDRFDRAVDDAVGNDFLVAALTGVRTHLARIRRLARGNPARLTAAASEHMLIIEAIIDGDASLAGHATHVHLHKSLTSVLAELAQSADRRA